MSRARLTLIVFLILGSVMSRLLPHPPNFTAIGGASLFAGATLNRKWLSLAIPLIAMLLSDAVIGFHILAPVIYLGIALYVVMSWTLSSRSTIWRFAGTAVFSSLTFYFISNFAVWMSGGLYPKTPHGLFLCYVAALPFLGNLLCADVLFTVALLSALRIMERASPSLRDAPERFQKNPSTPPHVSWG